ncbi:MAG TPA: HEAT repeat domain-containing protein [Sedimentisphaerales bacterium]|nr:HEAT repeat domain-containing protein [Sedimentisphaerales bacterium]
MLNRKTIAVIFAAGVLAAAACIAQSLEDHWNDYLHYALIGRLDMAKANALAIIESKPDPVALHDLSQANPQGYALLLRAKDTPHDPELAELSTKLWELIELGKFIRRTDPQIIVEEVKRLSSTERGRHVATKRLRSAGEYAISFMLDALADPSRRDEWPNVIQALPEIGRDAIRPLGVALQTGNVAVKAEIVKALGGIRYPQALPYLKYVIENDQSTQLRELAGRGINQINPAALNMPAAELFYRLAQDYYYHGESLAPAEDAEFANVWFWDANTGRLTSEKVDKNYFYELMAMRECEWALKADAAFGQAIGLWLAAYFKAESTNIEMPNYFGPGHADAMTYATTAGPEYLHQALARAVKDNNAYVALGAIEALAVTAGEKSLLYRLGTAQPLVQALSFNDRAVRYSAAIAIASAGPKEMFPETILVVRNLAEALAQEPQAESENSERWNPDLAHSYALRAVTVMAKLAQTRNRVIDLSAAQTVLMDATKSRQPKIQILAGQALAYLDSPDAQRSIASMALAETNAMDVRLQAFASLAASAKVNARLLDNETVDAIYSLVSSREADSGLDALRAAAAAAYGALNLPSQKVNVLILDQAKS